MTDTQRQLLRAIITNPADDTARLVYADYIQENGEEGRAEFIRVQVELAASYPNWSGIPGTGTYGEGGPYHLLKIRERELLEGKRRDWWPDKRFDIWSLDEPMVPYGYGIRAKCTRGFPSHIICTAEDFLKHADALVWNEGMTDECHECKGSGDIGTLVGRHGCYQCAKSYSERGTGCIPRPMPDTAQPIEKVTLTTLPASDRLKIEAIAKSRGWDVYPRATYLPLTPFKFAWPGVEFELPHGYPQPGETYIPNFDGIEPEQATVMRHARVVAGTEDACPVCRSFPEGSPCDYCDSTGRMV